MGVYAPQQPADRALDVSNRARPKVNWWLRLTSSGWDRPLGTIEQREMARRSRLTAWIILGLLVVEVLLAPSGAEDPATLMAVAIAGAGTILAAVLNRAGLVTLAGSLLVILVIAADIGADFSAPHHLLDTIYLPSYDLLVIAVVVGASILPRSAAFVVAFINIGVIIADFTLQPKTGDLLRLYHAEGAIPLLARPIALQILVATVAYLWVRGTDGAIRRADRAEEIANLEHAVAEQKRQLDVGIQQILDVHVRVANGDYSTRAPLNQENLLWQIAASLNNLISRIQKTAQAEHQLRRTDEEMRRLAAAIDDAQTGRRPIWPAPSGTSADLIIERITGRSQQPLPPPGLLSNPASMRSGPSQYPLPPVPPSVPPSWGTPASRFGSYSPTSGPAQPQEQQAPDWLQQHLQQQSSQQSQQSQPSQRSQYPPSGPDNPWFMPPDE